MRIAHVTATFPPYTGGTGNVCYHNCLELTRRGHEVHVFTAAFSGSTPLESRDGLTIHRLKPLFQIGNAPVLLNLPTVLRSFDLIHLHCPFILGAELVRTTSTLLNTPLVVSFHNDLIGVGVRKQLFQIYQILSSYLSIRSVACLCVVSLDHYYSSQLYRSLGNHNLKTIELPNGVDLSQFSPSEETHDLLAQQSIPANAKVVLFIAALDRAHHFKGLDDLLWALQKLPPDVWLLVIGDGDLRATYEQHAHKLGIADRTVFIGSIKHEETPPFFRRANVTVLPSSPPESFGLVLIESLACGTPVVATRIPGVRTVVDHGNDGLLVEPNSPIALADAIYKILCNDVMAQEMSRKGRVKVEARYGWESIGKRLENTYCQILEEQRTRSLHSSNVKSKETHREAKS
jgi:glycosyltransferase involved in cell wall biosynthesis